MFRSKEDSTTVNLRKSIKVEVYYQDSLGEKQIQPGKLTAISPETIRLTKGSKNYSIAMGSVERIKIRRKAPVIFILLMVLGGVLFILGIGAWLAAGLFSLFRAIDDNSTDEQRQKSSATLGCLGFLIGLSMFLIGVITAVKQWHTIDKPKTNWELIEKKDPSAGVLHYFSKT